MEIIVVARHGVPHAEIEAHRSIQSEFNSTPFSKPWRGYAAFALARPGRGTGDDDFDLVLITHADIILIELKNWNGKLLKSDGGKWYFDGDDRGESPVNVVNRKARKLASELDKRLGQKNRPFVSAYVVLHGKIDKVELPEDEGRSVLTMTEFLTFRFESCYREYFRSQSRINPLDSPTAYDTFFKGSSFKPRDYLVEGFRPDPKPIFVHPKQLYSEFRGVAKDDQNARALIRQWDFQRLGTDFIGESARAVVALREQRIFEYVAERSDELSLSLLRPLSRKAQKDVTTDFYELFALPPRVIRLAEFVNATLPKLAPPERLALVKVIIAKCAELHDLLIAHRDLSAHSVWLDRPTRVVLSGFSAAHYPEMRTVGAFRDKVKVEQLTVPDIAGEHGGSTPYQRDVYMLAVVAHQLLYGERPPMVDGKSFWRQRADDPYASTLQSWFIKSLSETPGERFASAREMLEALNKETADKTDFVVDSIALDAFKAATKERDYQVSKSLADNEQYSSFTSQQDSTQLLIKVWYGIDSEISRPDGSLRVLSFLERARAVRSSGLNGLPRIVDFGLSRGALLLVQEWSPGMVIPDWLASNPDIDARLAVASSLIDTIERMHAIDLVHGDIHPNNVIVRDENQARLIDVLDFRRGSDDAYTTAYLPSNYKSLSLADRDRYGTLAVVAEILGSSRVSLPKGSFDLSDVYVVLRDCLNSEIGLSLAPTGAALERASATATYPTSEHFELVIRNLTHAGVSSGELLSDNGFFHVSVEVPKGAPNTCTLWITGVGVELRVDWDNANDRQIGARIRRIPQSQVIRSQTLSDARVKMDLTVREGPSNSIDELSHYLLRIPALVTRIAGKMGSHEESGAGVVDSASAAPAKGTVLAIWKALLDAEEDAFPTVVVAADSRANRNKSGQMLLPCHVDTGILDFEPNERIVVQNRDRDDQWRDFGLLDFRESSIATLCELAIDNPSAKANVRIGSKLRLIGAGSKGSLTKRRFAVDRILADRAIVAGLYTYFDPAAAQFEPMVFSGPTAADLQIYSSGVWRLNQSQCQAFSRILTSGPISLLQGPPGTGKTTFIAALLHYLVTRERARRILLVSQTHEAVNNALEKASELFLQTGTAFDAVRLGMQSVVSEPIRSLTTDSVEQSYREGFKAEQQSRLMKLGVELGLPSEFCKEFIALQLRLRTIANRMERLHSLQGMSDADGQHRLARVTALQETFFEIANDVYDIREDESPLVVLERIEDRLIATHGVLSPDAVERLRGLVSLSAEWISALGSPDANFVEFLARARTIVAGTCVGIGQRGAGVAQNIYDWVIIDEAGRAAPSELAVSMQTGRRILLVGDHKQLPPTFSEDVREAMRQKFGPDADDTVLGSDFARIFDSDYGRKVGATLVAQYRMVSGIGKLVSDCFYDGLLETARGPSPEYYEFLPAPLSKEVTWIDTADLRERAFEQRSNETESASNDAEARVVMGVLRRIVESEDFVAFLADDLTSQNKAHEVPIGVICFYDRQRELIDRLLAESTWLGDLRRWVKVDTVDGYQGKENRIVIVSTVRNNPKANAGFLKNPNRINVAVSRAMERLVIVGSTTMWNQRNRDLPLGRVLTHIEAQMETGSSGIEASEQFLE